jgi:GDP-L-fucose synthase
MPTNLYGPGDNYHSENSHVIPGMLRRFHEAKESGSSKVTVWGSGKPRREFMYVDDMAHACVSLMSIDRSTYQAILPKNITHVNVGTGVDHSILDLAQMISKVVGYNGQIEFDKTKPDGSPQKLLNISLLNSMGCEGYLGLTEGLALTYKHFVKELMSSKARV